MNEQIARTVVDRFLKTWNAKDIEAFSACFKEDGDFVNVLGEMAKGRQAIAEMHKFPFATVQSKAIASIQRLELRELDSQLVGADMWWKAVGSLTPKGEPLPERFGLIYFVIDVKSGDGLIVSGRNMDYSNSYGREAVRRAQASAH
ncbi:MAG: SgcJ/EcaC family oxidoreductase [Candidatus Acidiferrales bacterium]